MPSDVWAFPSEAPADFAAAKKEVLVPGSPHLKDCLECLREGRRACDGCSAEGKSPCPHCRGKGRYPCEACRGLGKVNCLRCSGRGLKETSQLMISSADACPSCQGAGKVACGTCKEGELPCGFCSQAGVMICSKCRGEKTVVCPNCNGKKQFARGVFYLADFKPMNGVETIALVTMPPDVLAELLSRKDEGVPIPVVDASLATILKEASLPAPVAASLRALEQKYKPMLSGKTRVCRETLALMKREALRLTGTFGGQEMVVWVTGEDKVIPQKNPFQGLIDAVVAEAEAAAEKNEWAAALEAAKRARTYDPEGQASRRILRLWRRKVAADCLLASAAAGATAAVAGAVLIAVLEKGIHKVGPAFQASAALFLVSLFLSVAWIPLARWRYRFWPRVGMVFGLSLAVLAGFGGLARGVLGWDGVLAADRKAFTEEFHKAFPHGISDVYWEEDMKELEAFKARYGASRVDLAPVEEGLKKQKSLKKKRDEVARRFRRESDEILGSRLSPAQKLARLKELRGVAGTNGIDVSSTDKAVARLDKEAKDAAEAEKHKSVLRISTNEPSVAAKKSKDKKAEAKKKKEEKEKKKAEKKKSAKKKTTKR